MLRAVRHQNQGYASRKSIPWKIIEQIGIDMLYVYIFFNYNVWKATATELFLEPSQTYVTGTFCENS